MGNFVENVKLLHRLNGHKFLVPGNHDRVSSLESPARQERFRPYYEDAGFTILPEHTSVVINGISFQVSHYPYEGDSQDNDRHSAMRPIRDGRLLIHGHVHEKWRINVDMFNVGVDVNNFAPVHEDDIIFDWTMSVWENND
jgi:calcineurin-like phosphoesterase family protein